MQNIFKNVQHNVHSKSQINVKFLSSPFLERWRGAGKTEVMVKDKGPDNDRRPKNQKYQQPRDHGPPL